MFLPVTCIDNVMLVGAVTKTYAAFDDLCPSLDEDLHLRLNPTESFVYIPCNSKDDNEHRCITEVYDRLMQQRRQAGKLVLTLQTRCMVLCWARQLETDSQHGLVDMA